MTLIHRFTLGGYSDIDLGIELLNDYVEPVLPAPRARYVDVPGRAGRWEFDGDIAEREFALECAIVDATTQAELAAKGRVLAAILLDDDGVPKDVSLVFTKESDKTYTVRYAGKVPLSRLVGGTKGYFTLPLVAADPFAYSAQATTNVAVTTSPQTETINNTGNVSSPVTITIINNGAASVSGIQIGQRKV